MINASGNNLAKAGYTTNDWNLQGLYAQNAVQTLLDVNEELELIHFEVVGNSPAVMIDISGYDNNGMRNAINVAYSAGATPGTPSITNLNTDPMDILKVVTNDTTNNVYKVVLAEQLYFSRGCKIQVWNTVVGGASIAATATTSQRMG